MPLAPVVGRKKKMLLLKLVLVAIKGVQHNDRVIAVVFRVMRKAKRSGNVLIYLFLLVSTHVARLAPFSQERLWIWSRQLRAYSTNPIFSLSLDLQAVKLKSANIQVKVSCYF